MSRPFPKRVCRWPLVGSLLLWAAVAVAQLRNPPVEPRWLRLDATEWSVGTEVEGLMEEVSVGGVSSTHEQLSLTPLVGLRTRGSVYHPNLMAFNLTGESGWSWLTDHVSGPSSSSTRDENGDLLRYLALVSFLSGKPYNATFSASQDHTYRNYDPFSTYTVDTTRYGGHVGWRTKSLTLNADVGFRDEESTGINGVSRFSETFVNFSGIQTRPNGQSSLTYRYSEFDTALDSSGSQSSTTHSIGVSDSEVFGARKQISATTGAGFSQSEYAGRQTETFIASESVTIKHRPKLDSYVNANFSHSRLDSFTSSFLQGEAGVRHRLYDSLTSTFDVHGHYDESSGSGIAASNSRYGLGLRENYTKRLGNWGRLSVGGGIIAEHEEHESSGTVLPVPDEPHNLTNAPVFLNRPRVIPGSIQVRSALDNTLYAEGADYRIFPSGELTEIRLVPGSMNVALHGSEVFVNYQSESLYDAAFESFTGTAQIRLDLYGKFGVYGRLNWLDNNAPPEALTQTLTDLVGGADYSWRWFRAGAEYEDYDSNFVQYQAWRFFQSFNYLTSRGDTLGVDFIQNFYRYPDNFNQDRYQFTSRYHTLLTFSLAWDLEGGYALQDVVQTEQNFAYARTALSWTRGKLNIRAGYEYNYQTTATGPSTEQRDRHRFFTYLKRTF